MSSPVRSIMRKLSNEPINILSISNDGLFEYSLAELGYKVFVPVNPGKTNENIKHDNLVFLHGPIGDSPISYEFDCVMIHDKLSSYEIGARLSDHFHIPLILVEHYYRLDSIKNEQVMMLQQQKYWKRINASYDVSRTWGVEADGNILYNIPITNKPKNNTVLVYGQFTQQDSQLLFMLKNLVPNLKIIGAGLLTENCDPFIELSTCSTFINLVNSTKIPIPMLYAMGAGARVISSPCTWYKDFPGIIWINELDTIQQNIAQPFKNAADFIAREWNQQQFEQWIPILDSIRMHTWK